MNRSGGSIIELVVAVAIVGVGITGVASLTATAVRTMARARALDDTHATLLNFMDSMRVEGGVGSGQRSLPLGTLTWSVPDVTGGDAWAQFDHVALPDPVLLRFSVLSASSGY